MRRFHVAWSRRYCVPLYTLRLCTMTCVQKPRRMQACKTWSSLQALRFAEPSSILQVAFQAFRLLTILA
jgi:hypothetical protein